MKRFLCREMLHYLNLQFVPAVKCSLDIQLHLLVKMPEYYAAEAPKRDLVFVQAETEVAAFNMIAGAAAAGKRAMTGTAGPGFSLGQEAMSYMAAAGLPAVVVNVMRPGPADGEILGSQGDYFQAVKGGGHGDYNVICMTPYSVQEQADMIQEAFDLAENI